MPPGGKVKVNVSVIDCTIENMAMLVVKVKVKGKGKAQVR